MLKARKIYIKFWPEALNTACDTLNPVYLYPRTSTTAYELWTGKKPNHKHFYAFECTCFILNDKDQRNKFYTKSDEGIFMGYSTP